MEDVDLGREDNELFIDGETFLLSPQVNELMTARADYTSIASYLLWALQHIIQSGGCCNKPIKSLGFNGRWSNNATKYVPTRRLFCDVTILYCRRAALLVYYVRTQLLTHYNVLMPEVATEDKKAKLAEALVKLERGDLDEQLVKALLPETVKLSGVKLKDWYTSKSEALLKMMSKIHEGFAIRKTPKVKSAVSADFNEGAFNHYIRLCRADATSKMFWKAVTKLTPLEEEYEARLSAMREVSSKVGDPFKVIVF